MKAGNCISLELVICSHGFVSLCFTNCNFNILGALFLTFIVKGGKHLIHQTHVQILWCALLTLIFRYDPLNVLAHTVWCFYHDFFFCSWILVKIHLSLSHDAACCCHYQFPYITHVRYNFLRDLVKQIKLLILQSLSNTELHVEMFHFLFVYFVIW